ncbi:MAG: hypothetical protein WD066_09715 [Planctomycetaceae bacterium]
MTDEAPSETNAENFPESISVDYLKSQGFRVIKVDGVIGGVSPRGELMMSLWNERVPIPQHTAYQVGEGGKIGVEIPADRVGRGGLVREVEFCAFMNLDVAMSIAKWIEKHIDNFRSLSVSAKKKDVEIEPADQEKDK